MKTPLTALHTIALAFVVAALGGSFVRAQGPLTPPGAPAPTMKTLDQIEPRTPISSLPFTISGAGSYYVTGNLTGAVGQPGIVIDADNVTLDLGGFELIGSSGAVVTGIRVINAHVNAVIRNGTVRGWPGNGVVAQTSACTEMRVENVRSIANTFIGILVGARGTVKDCEVRGNGNTGIIADTDCKVIACNASAQSGSLTDGIHVGDGSLVADCTASGNSGDGIQTGENCTVRGCIATSNSRNGIELNEGGTVQDCAARSNTGVGIATGATSALTNCSVHFNGTSGIDAGVNCTLIGCSAKGNGSSGIFAANASTLSHCAAYENTDIGISVGTGVAASYCTASNNQGTAGIRTVAGCALIGCVARGNTSASTISAGILAGSECHISQCLVTNTTSTAGTPTSTTGMGISTGANSTVECCTVQGSRGDGIQVLSDCLVLNNTVSFNCASGVAGQGGIHVTSNRNRIENNQVTRNSYDGILIDNSALNNFILKNTSALNAQFQYRINGLTAAGLTGTNECAPLQTLKDATNAWANFQLP